MRLIDADELKKNFQDELCRGIACDECSMQVGGFCRVERWIDIAPTIVTEPTMMCNGYHIKCPAYKDYEQGYKDGKAKALMMKQVVNAEPIKHGRWIKDENDFLICSECGNIAEYLPILGQIETPYCSECGAKMSTDGRDEVEK